ncbi:MAG: lamin tail domain-containing protein [Deltaproteobacteria bacterium]|nr:lamin tail domain-containing protein [Deltaproteobacteria bacterium]
MKRATLLGLLALASCNPAPSQADLDSTRGGRVDVYFNDPGTNKVNMWDPDVVDVMVDMIDGAGATLDVATMGFSRREIYEATVRAWERGVKVRFVGDAGHVSSSGYQAMRDAHIPMSIGNLTHIMHEKFFVVDGRFVFSGTANFTSSDMAYNSNNYIVVDSPEVANDFTDEFNQMFNGAFGAMKVEIDNGRRYTVGDTEIEVWFSPNEDVMGRMLELVDGAEDSVRFTIFAFTKDQVGSAFIRKQEEFKELNAAEGLDEDLDFRDRHSVAGVIDQSQLHSNGQYHELYRLLAAGVKMRMDGDDNEKQPGDYQASGGRLHSKTMIIDLDSDDPKVISGSFNWSASASMSNDEFLLVMHGARVAQEYNDYFEKLYDAGRDFGKTRVADGSVAPGDVVINELQWYGYNSSDLDGFDEFIELRNTTDRDLVLDLWQISGADDFTVGLPPGSTIPAGGLFTIVDHVLEPYQDGAPQDTATSILRGDLVLNPFNDNRAARLYLKDGALELSLRDPDAVEIDRAGNGGPAYAGGPQSNGKVRSMERNANPGDGRDPASWHACSLSEGIGDINPDYASEVIASPGVTNSAP